MSELNHFDEKGNARMVDVSEKDITERTAVASGKIYVSENTFRRIADKSIEKGDVLTVAQVAGIMAVKKTSDLIPMTHPLAINGVSIEFSMNEEEHYIESVCKVKINERTGVEIEAITGVSVSLITIYDMVKAIDYSMNITDIRLLYKNGGKRGEYIAKQV